MSRGVTEYVFIRSKSFARKGLSFASLAAILSTLRAVYPEKAAYLKDEGLRRIVAIGGQLAAQHDIRHMRGTAVFVFLVFALGHGFANDPLYPWLRNVLVDPLLATPEDRAARLEAKAVIYLDRVIEYVRDL